jgi:pyruvate/2-oxoglutarate dehydrogenase complex dihydrolipoamide dehydrogenase (E3) component
MCSTEVAGFWSGKGNQRGGNISEIESYNLLVIGSGEAGKYLAWTMAKAGHRTAVAERRYIGSSCPNIACLPSKNVIHRQK